MSLLALLNQPTAQPTPVDIGNRLNFEDLVVGDPIVSADLPPDWIVEGTGGTLTVTSASWTDGVKAARTVDATTARNFTRTMSGSSTACQTVYFVPRVIGTQPIYLSGGTGTANWRINIDRTVQARNVNTAVGVVSTAVLAIDTVYRAEHWTHPSAAQQQLKVFEGDSTTPIYDSGMQVLATTARTNLKFGATAAAAGWTVDILAAWIATTWTGPWTVAPAPPAGSVPNITLPSDIVAHRAMIPGPANTLKGFAFADANAPTAMMDMDVQECATPGVWVLAHDTTIDATVHSSSPILTGNVESFTEAQWRTIRFKNNDNTDWDFGCTIQDIVDRYGPSGTLVPNKVMSVELKTTSTSYVAFLDYLEAQGMRPQTIFTTFGVNPQTSSLSKNFYVQRVWASTTPTQADVNDLANRGVKMLCVNKANLTAQVITWAHAVNMKVSTFTVNTTAERDTWRANGADSIISDDPSVLLASGSTAKNGSDTASIAIAETSSIDVTRTTNDAASVSIAETSSALVSLSTTDTASLAIADASTLSLTLSTTDTSALTVSETSSPFVSRSTTDTSSATISESAALGRSSSASDASSVTVAESSAISVQISTTDTSSVAISETSTTTAAYNATDTSGITISDVSSNATSSSRTDTSSVATTESAAVAATSSTTDTGSLAVSESTSVVTVQFASASDTSSVSIAESATQVVAVTTSDTGAVAISETTSINPSLTTNDSASVSITESRTTLVTLSAIDSSSVAIGENTSPNQDLSTSDSSAVGIAETTSLVVTFSKTDTSSVSISEATSFVKSSVVTANDSATVSISESRTTLSSLSRTDTSAVSITETKTLFQQLTSTDTSAVTIGETLVIARVLSTTDTGSVIITEQSTKSTFGAKVVYGRADGLWVPGTMKVYVDGVWKTAAMRVRIGESWV